MVRTGKIVVIAVVVLTFIALQDLVIHGVNAVQPFFDRLSGRQDYFQGDAPLKEPVKQTQNGQLVRPVDDLEELVLSNSRGNIEVQGTDGEQIIIDYTLSVFADEREQAEEYLKKMSLAERETDGSLVMAWKEPKIREEYIRDVGVNYRISLPRGVDLKISNTRGAVKAENLQGNLTVLNHWGAITAAHLVGNLVLDTKFSELELTDIKGDIKLNTMYRDAFITGVEGDIELQNHDAYVDIAGLNGNLTATQNTSGRLEVNEMVGKLQITENYGEVRARNVTGLVTIKSGAFRSDVELQKINGDIDVESRHGDIRVELVPEEGYEIFASTRGGKIRTRLHIALEKKDGIQTAKGLLGSGKYKADLRTESGDIFLKNY